MAQTFTLKQLWNRQLKEYKKQQHKFLLTSRFNTETWSQNKNYRRHHSQIGCIYCSPDPISQHIPSEAIMFILEMNNDANKIMGIGMVRNNPNINKYNIYTEGNYNRYVYMGNTRIGREEMNIEEDKIMQVFDILCFKGNKHMKRGQGLKSFPTDMLFRCSNLLDLVEFISKMFKKRLS